jgi:hypothetical protein
MQWNDEMQPEVRITRMSLSCCGFKSLQQERTTLVGRNSRTLDLDDIANDVLELKMRCDCADVTSRHAFNTYSWYFEGFIHQHINDHCAP